MKRSLVVVLGILVSTSLRAADKVDPRLATVRKAFVIAVDNLSDDQAVAACLTERLSELTPLESVKTKEEADVVLRVKTNIPGAAKRYGLGMMGGTPSATLDAELPDGTKLWRDGAKNRKGGTGAIGAARSKSGIGCGLATGLLETLRSAMQKARDGKP
jgi:hypothetical protein